MHEFELLPFVRGREPGASERDLQATCDAALSPYYTGDARIRTATLVRHADRPLTCDVSEEERTALFTFAELLAASGLAAREFFRHDYQNRDNFLLVIQPFPESGPSGAAIRTRRRDGTTLSGWTFESYRVQRPEHVDGSFPCTMDWALLDALLQVRDDESWPRIYDAVVGFNRANTDSPGILQSTEAVLLVGAFQRVLETKSDERRLGQKLANALAPSSNVAPGAIPALASRGAQFKTVRESWIRDFCGIRGNVAHGKLGSAYEPVWSLPNHLLLGSVAFPLVLKRELQTLGKYSFTSHDRANVDVFERLASFDHFAPREQTDPHPWDVVREERNRLMLRRGLEALLNE